HGPVGRLFRGTGRRPVATTNSATELAERVSSTVGTERSPSLQIESRPAANIPALAVFFARLREKTSANNLRAMQHGCFPRISFLSAIRRLGRGGTKSK